MHAAWFRLKNSRPIFAPEAKLWRSEDFLIQFLLPMHGLLFVSRAVYFEIEISADQTAQLPIGRHPRPDYFGNPQIVRTMAMDGKVQDTRDEARCELA